MSEVASLLAQAQRLFPDQRACQIIFNALDGIGMARTLEGKPKDLFYMTDATVVEGLRMLLKRYS